MNPITRFEGIRRAYPIAQGVLVIETSADARPAVLTGGQELLILAGDDQTGVDPLALPFAHAEIVTVGAKAHAVAVEGEFDTIVLDGWRADFDRLEALLGQALPVLRPAGRVVLTLRSGAPSPLTGRSPTLESLRWEGPVDLGGCVGVAMSRVSGHPETDRSAPPEAQGPVTRLVVAALTTACWVAHRHDAGADGCAADMARALRQADAARRRSERALLSHVGATGAALVRARRATAPRAMLMRLLNGHLASRFVLRLVRRCRRRASARA
jgi:hypothetical protein